MAKGGHLSILRVLHLPAAIVWLIGAAGIANQFFGIANFLSSIANEIAAPSQSAGWAMVAHLGMIIIGITGHFVIEKYA